MLSQILATEKYCNDYAHDPPDLTKWDIVDGKGIPNKGIRY